MGFKYVLGKIQNRSIGYTIRGRVMAEIRNRGIIGAGMDSATGFAVVR